MDSTTLPPPELALVAAVDALAAQAPADLPGEAALERTRVVLAQSDRLRTLVLQALSDVEARQLYVHDGAASTTSWAKAQDVVGITPRDVTLSRRLRALPLVEAELLSGRLSSAAAALVATAVLKAKPFLDRPDGLIDGQPAVPALYGVLVDGVCDQLAEQTGGAPADDPDQQRLRTELEALLARDASELATVEAAFVLLAQRSVPTLLPSALALLLDALLLDALLPAEHDARARKAQEQAHLHLRRRHAGSGWDITGVLDDETGELLDTVLRAEQAVDEQAPDDTGAWRAAAAAGVVDLDTCDWPSRLSHPRTRGQRAHDALRLGLRTLLGAGLLGARDKAVPHIAVTVSLDHVSGVPGALPGRAQSGARWSRRQVRELLCRSAFTRLVLDARRRVVEVSHTQRTATALERQISYLQWGWRCAVSTCIRGPATGHVLVPHHGNLFSHTGTTSLDDTVPLCEQDHHHLHQGRRSLRLEDGRWIGPDGWVEPQPRAG